MLCGYGNHQTLWPCEAMQPRGGKIELHLSFIELEHSMTTKDKVAWRKLSLLQLANELSNVSKTCQIKGYSKH